MTQIDPELPAVRDGRQLDADDLLRLGRRHLQDNRPAAALDVLLELERLSPNDSLVFQELGRAHAALDAPVRAIGAYEKATRLNPALLRSWQALAELQQAHGDAGQAAEARARARFLRGMPKDLRAVASLLHRKKLRQAEILCRGFLKRFPRNTEGMRLLANIGAELNILDDAEFLLESALVFRPDFRAARFDYVNVLRKRQKFEPAMEQVRMLLESDPDNEIYRSMYASICLAVGEAEASLAAYEQLTREHPNPLHFLHRGHALKTVGRQAEAIASYRRATRLKPDFGDAYWSLGNLKTYQFADSEIGRMKACEADAGTSFADRFHLCFALGKALENREEYAESFEYYARGNRLKHSGTNYDPRRIESEAKRQLSVCSRRFFRRRAGLGWPAGDPIFIVGLPRAGSTLLEQILASHPQVDGTFELPNILALAHKLNGRPTRHSEPEYPGVLRRLRTETLRKLGKQYIDSTRIYRQGAPFFTDKMPNNFRHIGLIKLILPNARIIDARRDPMACCFSVYKQLFAEGQEFSYSLEDVARYYRVYVRLMEHWNAVFPGQICLVRYENVVMNIETEVRRLLDHCGLPFHRGCLDFHKTSRAVRTASSEQVRQPLYTSGLEQWKHYDAHLQPLRDALGTEGP